MKLCFQWHQVQRDLGMHFSYTVRRGNCAVSFLPNIHAIRYGVCFVGSAFDDILPQFLQLNGQYHVFWNPIITTLDCNWLIM